jgi:hypothetical protein
MVETKNTAAVEAFIRRWQGLEGGQERANYVSFLNELIDVLGLPKPDPAAATHEHNDYVFERAVKKHKDEGDSHGRIDLYKKNSFVLEAKQSRLKGAKKVAGQNDLFTADIPEDSRDLDDKSRFFWNEQQKLVSDVEEGTKTVGALKIYGATLSLLNLVEGVMARNPMKEVVTTDPITAFDGAESLKNRLDGADETTLLLAEQLSAKLMLRSDSIEAQLSAKAVRAFVLGELLSQRLATVRPAYAMRADAIGKKLISDLLEASLVE